MKIAVIGYGAFGKAAAELFFKNNCDVSIVTSKNREMVSNQFAKYKKLEDNYYDLIVTARKTSHDLIEIIKEQNIKAKIIIDISTNPLKVVEKMYEYFDLNNILYVELPQLGSPITLANGQSTSLSYAPIIRDNNLESTVNIFGKNILLENRLDPTKLKLMHNFLAAGYLSLYSSVFKTADYNKIPRSVLSQVLDLSPLKSNLLDAKKEMIIENKYSEAKFSVENMLKDINLFSEIIEEDIEQSSLAFVKGVFENAIKNGYGKLDTSSVAS